MKISDLQKEYRAFYYFYGKIKNPSNGASTGAYGKVADLHDRADQSYRRFKSSVREMCRTHPEQAPALQKILSNTRILRHRQKLLERNVFTVSEDSTFLGLSGKSKEVKKWLSVLNENLQIPLQLLNESKKRYQHDLKCLKIRDKTAIETFKKSYESSQKRIGSKFPKIADLYSSKEKNETVREMLAQQKQSPDLKALKERGKALAKTEQEVTAKYNELKELLVQATKAHRKALEPSEEKRCLEKLDRIRVKIARFRDFGVYLFGISRS